MKVHDGTFPKIWVKFWKFLEKLGKNFFEIWENFFEIRTAVYKAGLSKVGYLKNLVTKTVIEYPVLPIVKIYKNKKFISPIFLKKILRATKKFFCKKIGDVNFDNC